MEPMIMLYFTVISTSKMYNAVAESAGDHSLQDTSGFWLCSVLPVLTVRGLTAEDNGVWWPCTPCEAEHAGKGQRVRTAEVTETLSAHDTYAEWGSTLSVYDTCPG